jgi:hypothetical protein
VLSAEIKAVSRELMMLSQSKMIEHQDKRIWDIGGHEVTCIHIDYRFAFDCRWTHDNENNGLYVVIETPFTVRYTDRTVVCEPGPVNSVKEALSILHKPVSTLTAFRDSRLLITFVDTTQLEVPKHPVYESWEASGTGELKDLALLCSPHPGPPWRE